MAKAEAPGPLQRLLGSERPWLELKLPNGASERRVLYPGAYRIGRDPSCEIRLTDSAISKQHGWVEQRGSTWLLRDCGSTNGLWWRGHRLQELVLVDGDRIGFGPEQGPTTPELLFRSPRCARLRRLAQASTALMATAVGGGVLLLGLSLLRYPLPNTGVGQRGPLVLYDRLNRPLDAEDSQQRRPTTDLSAYPTALISALLASEDSRFWWHPGVDPIGTGRALIANLAGGRVLQGGSTLTQQLARSLYPEQVGQGETLQRKWRELLVALQLEARFSKESLLRSYLNRVYLGAGWGFDAAARRYFAKPASDLSLTEAALLVGLLPSPNGYDPCVNPEAALASRQVVLSKMVDTGRISEEVARRSRRQPLSLAPQACSGRAPGQRPVPFYTDQVRRDLEGLLGAEVAAEGNFLVETHLDPLLQEVVERQLRQTIAAAAPALNQGAVVVLDSRSGGVLAIAGGRDYSSSQFNRASLALRQPGSTFKLFTYLAALGKGLKPSDAVSCAPLDWGGQAFGSRCGGRLSLSAAFASSSNTAALRLARWAGLERVVQTARDLGITAPLPAVPGLVLGQSEVRLIELTAAYAAIANGGIWHAPSTIRRITDAEAGRTATEAGISQRTLNPGRQAVSPQVARQMQALLRGVVRNGTGSAARLGGDEGGKTGTTNEGRDLLFIGYEPRRQWTIGIWLGNDDNRATGLSSGLAAGLWGEIIRAAGAGSLPPRVTR